MTGVPKKSTRVADRAFPQNKVPWRQPGDFGRSSFWKIAMWHVTVLNGLQAAFNQPDGPSRPGHDWIVLMSKGSEQKRTIIRTYTDRFPSLTPQDFANVAIKFVQQQIASGWNPDSSTDPPESLVPDNLLASFEGIEVKHTLEMPTKQSWWKFWQ